MHIILLCLLYKCLLYPNLGLFPPTFVEDQKENDIRIEISETENKESCGILSRGNSTEKPISVTLNEDSSNRKERNYVLSFRDEEENMTNTFPASTTSHETTKSHENIKTRKKEEEQAQKGKSHKIIRYIAWVIRKLIRPISFIEM